MPGKANPLPAGALPPHSCNGGGVPEGSRHLKGFLEALTGATPGQGGLHHHQTIGIPLQQRVQLSLAEKQRHAAQFRQDEAQLTLLSRRGL